LGSLKVEDFIALLQKEIADTIGKV